MEDALLIDQWSGILDHKDTSMVEGLPDYYDDDQKRRLIAYRVLAAYMETIARELLSDESVHGVDELREFGDPAVIVERIAAAVLGDGPYIAVVGADDPLPTEPDLPPVPTLPEPVEGQEDVVTRLKQQIYEQQLGVWESTATARFDAWKAAYDERPRLDGRQDYLREWCEADRFLSKLRELENEFVVGLGDGAVVIGMDWENRRPTIEVMEPDAYMPVLSDGHPSEFPTTVHLVWQWEEEGEGEDDTATKLVRRITYELVPVDEVEGTAEAPLYLAEGTDRTHVCLHSDGLWEADDFESVLDVGSNPSRGWAVEVVNGQEVELNRLPTPWDFIPVVHVPNILSSSSHFGRSVLSRTIQLFDEIAAGDTDESLAARWAAKPPVVISNLSGSSDTVDLSPGQGVRGDKAEMLEMAKNLATLLDRNNGLLKRLSVNTSTPEGLLGRVDASEVPSGLALALSFTPFVQLIGWLREARDAKYPLILKFVQRMALQYREITEIDEGPVLPARVQFGPFMPQDLAGTATTIAQLRQANAISLNASSLALQSVAPEWITDVETEVAAIRAGDGDTALAIADATGSVQAAAEYLGIELDDPDGVDPDGDVVPPDGGITG